MKDIMPENASIAIREIIGRNRLSFMSAIIFYNYSLDPFDSDLVVKPNRKYPSEPFHIK